MAAPEDSQRRAPVGEVATADQRMRPEAEPQQPVVTAEPVETRRPLRASAVSAVMEATPTSRAPTPKPPVVTVVTEVRPVAPVVPVVKGHPAAAARHRTTARRD